MIEIVFIPTHKATELTGHLQEEGKTSLMTKKLMALISA